MRFKKPLIINAGVLICPVSIGYWNAGSHTQDLYKPYATTIPSKRFCNHTSSRQRPHSSVCCLLLGAASNDCNKDNELTIITVLRSVEGIGSIVISAYLAATNPGIRKRGYEYGR